VRRRALTWAWCLSALTVSATASAAEPLRLAVERDYPPFVFVDADGTPRGLSIDMLDAAAARAGLRIRPLPPQPLSTLLSQLQRGEADLITSLRPTPERAAFLAFTRPYVEVPAILLARDDAPARVADRGLAALAGQPVAVGAGYAVERPMREAHPGVAWRAVSDDTVALIGVARGEYAAAVVDAASAAWIIERHGLDALRSAGRVGFSYPLSFGVRLDQPQVVAALDKALGAMPAAERRAITERWMGSLPVQAMAPRRQWPAWLGAGALVLALALAWRRAGARDG